MKNKPISILKFGVLLFGISILLWSCEKETHLVNSQQPINQVEEI